MPHEIAPAETRRRAVIIGAGPAGLEAARVAAERGHHVTVFEVQPDPGGQVRLTAQNPRRREMISIIDWRMAQCAADYSSFTSEKTYDQILVNYSTLPLDDLYFELKPLSSNGGAVDHDALIEGRPQHVVRNTDGAFQLFRIGDAVSARNTHAAIYDALRLMKDI